MDGPYTPACKSSGGSRPLNPSGYAPVSRPEPPSSATAGNGFSALRGSRVSATSATLPAPIAPPPTPRLPLGKHRARQCQKQPLGHAPRRRGQTSASLSRRLRLALNPPLCHKNYPEAPAQPPRRDPANAPSPPQTG